MNKRPASLTSDLLARKGEATPSSIDPAARTTLGGAGMGFSDSSSPDRLFVHDDDDEDVLELRPQPPEPDVIYTAEDEEEGTKPLRLVAGLVVAVIAVGGIVLAISSKTERGAAPVTPQIADSAPQMAAPETDTAAQIAAQAPATTPAETSTSVPTSTVPPASPVEEDPVNSPYSAYVQKPSAQETPQAAAPVETAPAAPEPAAKPVTTPAPTSTPSVAAASGGDYVVQLFALKDEDSARKAYQALAKKHALLDGHAADIEKADLGPKGIYYRVRAAGFDSKADAASTCARLKAAGQDCMVKKR